MAGDEIFIEILPIGKALEIVAIDSRTLTEVRFVAPATASESEIKSLARAKMLYVLKKKQQRGEHPSDDDSGSDRGGIIV